MNVVIVSREFGSGGREVGKRLADALGYAYYDSEIVTMIAEKAKLDPHYVEEVLEKKQTLSVHFSMTYGSYYRYDGMSQILKAQKEVMDQITKAGNCVIVGRGANVFLTGESHNFSMFVYADEETKIKRILARDTTGKETAKSAKKMIRAVDRNRRKYQEMILGEEWGAKENYNLCVNTSGLEVKTLIPSLTAYIKNYFGE